MGDSQTTPNIYYTEDVKEAFHQARRVAKRRPSYKVSKQIFDWEYLMGMLYGNRAFSRLDCILHQMGIKPRDLQKRLEEITKTTTAASSDEDTAEPEGDDNNPLLDRTESLAAQNGPKPDTIRVDIEHLLLALCESDDNTVRGVLKEYDIAPKQIDTAHEALYQKTSVLNIPKFFFLSMLYFLREAVEIMVTVIIFLIIIKEGFGELRLIPSESMVPTLQIGDRLVIEKLTRWWRPYQRGDILVFYPPEPYAVLHNDPFSLFMRATGFSSLIHNTENDPVDKAYIKRLIGMPGDKIQVIPYQGVYINDEKIEEPYVNADRAAEECDLNYEPGDTFTVCFPTIIPEGHYLMMGDNRNNSKDGRHFGLEPKERVVGRAVFRILPPDRIGLLDPDR